MENQVNGKILALAAAFVLFATPALSQVDYTQPEIYNPTGSSEVEAGYQKNQKENEARQQNEAWQKTKEDSDIILEPLQLPTQNCASADLSASKCN